MTEITITIVMTIYFFTGFGIVMMIKKQYDTRIDILMNKIDLLDKKVDSIIESESDD